MSQVLIYCHRPLLLNPRGGEISVWIIAKFLRRHGHEVTCVHPSWPYQAFTHPEEDIAFCAEKDLGQLRPDVVLSWGIASSLAHHYCVQRDIPHIMMVRWWRNVAPIPPGDLRSIVIPDDFYNAHSPLFEYASSIICNNEYAARIVEKYYAVAGKTAVSYVPLDNTGDKSNRARDGGCITLVSPEKHLGEPDLINALARRLPHRTFYLPNTNNPWQAPRNVRFSPWDTDWVERTDMVLYPVYYNDVCGTSRVFIEAARYGIPSIMTNRSGLCEKGGYEIDREATADDWVDAIERMYAHPKEALATSRHFFATYHNGAQLRTFQSAIEEALI